MSGSQDEIPPPPPPPSSSQTPTQQTPHTVSTIKLPILKKGEYDIWAMKMEHYLAHTDYPIWEVIQNGNGPVSITTDTQGQIKVLPPRTAEEILARERERKARTTLLMALPEDHLAKFHKMTDAKEMWDAIKSRFGGNDESKKMQKYILKQQFEGFSVSNSEGLHKGYDRFQSLLSQLEIHGAGVSTEDANQKFLRSLPSAWSQVSLIMRTKPGVDSLSFDDLYNNLRVFENDVKGSTASSSSTQNVAFVSENTSSTNDVSTAYSVSNPSGQNSQYEQTSSYSLLANQSSCPQLDHEDLEQLDEFDLEEMDLKWQVAMISMRMKKFYQKTGRKLQFDAKEPVGNQDSRMRDAWNSSNKDGRRSGKQEDSKALVTIDGEGVDWTSHSEEEEDYALMACNSSGSDTEITSCLNECKESYAKLKKLYDAQREQLSDASIEIKAYTQGLKKVEAQLVAHQQGQLWLGYGDHRYDSILSYENKVLQSVFMNKESELEKQPLYDRNRLLSIYNQFTYGPKQSQPSESETQTSDFDTCESDCSVETHESLPEPTVNEPKVVNQPKVWSDAPIIEEYESDSEDEHVSQPTKEQEQPSFASTNKQVKTPRETVKNQFTHSKNPTVDKKGLGYGFTARACFVCGSLSHLIRDCDFHEKRMAKQAELNNSMRMKSSQRVIRPIWNNVQRVNHKNQFVPIAVLTRTGKILINTARASGTNNVSTARHDFNRQAVPTNAAMKVNTVKPIVNRVRPANVFYKTHSPFSRSFINTTALRTNFSYQKVNTAEVNVVSVVGGKRETAVKPSSGCNWRQKGHYWQNISKYNNGSSLRNSDYPHRALKHKGIVDSGCSRHMTGNKAYLAEYQDFNGGPVAFGGSKGYITGKGKIKTGKLDFEDVCFVKELQHFNLFSVSQICDKKNKVLFTDSECLVLSPEFKLPDENQVLLRIPRQNNMYSFNLENIVPSGGLACLIAKATIDESNKWHRRLGHVNFKNLNKLVKGNLVRGLPSKIFQNDHTCVACQKGKQHKASCKAKSVSSISHSLQLLHMDLFGPTSVRSLNHKTYCLVITDDFSSLNGKSIKGFKLGIILYKAKAFVDMVYNLDTKRVEENMHITFLENKPNVAGKGPTWLLDLDYLTDSMNYQPVRSENQANKYAGPQEANQNAGTEDNIDACDSEKEDESTQDYFVLPIWSSYSSTEKDAGEAPNKYPDLKTDENLVEKEDQVFLDELERLKRQEKDANDAAEALRKEFAQETENLLLQAGCEDASTKPIETQNAIYGQAKKKPVMWMFHQVTPKDYHLKIHNMKVVNFFAKTYFLAMQKADNCGYFYYRGKYVAAANCCPGKFCDSKSNVQFLVVTIGDDSIHKRIIKGEAILFVVYLYEVFSMQKHFSPSVTNFKQLIGFSRVIGRDKDEKTEGNAEFHEVIDFLARSSIHHALTECPGKITPFICFYVSTYTNEDECYFRENHLNNKPTSLILLHPSEANSNLRSDPHPRPSFTPQIPDSNPRFLWKHRGQSSSDKSLSGNEGDMTLQSVYDLCISLCKQVTDQAKEIKHLKAQIKLQEASQTYCYYHHKLDPEIYRTRIKKVPTKDKDSQLSLDEGTDNRTEARSATPTSLTTTPTMFGDDETIAQTERPRPTSTRSLLTLKPLPKIDPKDKGKKKIEEEDESDTESEDIPEAEKKFKQLARDEEMARKLQEDWESEEERKRLAEEEATKDCPFR
ncbi:putative ribonuclease H-like domain-containing protein [Tanacetum coccineum]